MKLKELNRSNCGMSISREPVIRFNDSGMVALNHSAMLALDVCKGDTISIIQDEYSHEQKDYYIGVKTESGYTLRSMDGDNRSVGFGAKALVIKLKKQFKIESRTFGFRISADKVEHENLVLFPMITRKVI